MNNLDVHPPEGAAKKLLKGFGKYKMVYTINEMDDTKDIGQLKAINEQAPDTLSEGPVVRRKIQLPTMDTYSNTENLIKPSSNQVKDTGVVNPAFVDTMETVNIEAPSWSDTSSDNMKDPNSSRASTLTRQIQESEINQIHDMPEVKETVKPYKPPPESRDSTLLSNTDRKSTFKPWDVFRVSKRNKQTLFDDASVSVLKKVVKIIVSIVLSILIAVLTMLSKSTLFLITSNVYVNVTLDCVYTGEGHFVESCRRVPPDEPLEHKFQFSQGVEVRWLWALLTVVCTPYFFTFLKSFWRVLFKKTRSPSWKVLGIVLLIETLHSLGMSIFVFYVLPSMDPIRGLMLTFGVAVIPSILKIFDSQTERGRTFYILAADVLAMVFQVSILLLWPIRNFIQEEDYRIAWSIFVSLLLISLGWWENYVNKYTRLGKFGAVLRDFKRNIRRMRTKIYMVVSIWKVFVTFGFMLALMSEFKLPCITAMVYSGDDKAMDCPHFVFPVSALNVQGKDFRNDPFWIAVVQIVSCLFCYTFAKSACKLLLQVVSFSLPLMLVAPIMAGLFMGSCETWKISDSTGPLMPSYLYWTCDIHGITYNFLNQLITDYYLPVTLGWWLSFMWVTVHIWIPRVERLVQTERLFVQPLYCGVLFEQSLMLNRRRDDKDRDYRGSEKAKRFQNELAYQSTDNGRVLTPEVQKSSFTPMIFVCATMWHETRKEMLQMLTSLFRLDNDQCARKNAQKFFDVIDPDYYEFEAHIFFDDAFEKHDDDEYEYQVNSFVKQFANVMDDAASNLHKVAVKIPPPTKYPTPYGGRLEWTLPGNNKLQVHLKDKAKIRHKKRWSQVMYMYYLLGYRLVAQPLDARRKQNLADNTFILALDGDVDFKPSAVQLLVDRMKKNEKVGAACGRIHPVGSGPMVWYQKFEYAISHWLQKATEHMIGCVLCCPGCFSLFRASALMDDNVMKRYTTLSSAARHYVQYDQGEDRWLSTLLLQQGYRVEYSAAADALTYAPEGFDEFYNQRRRWTPSTMANIMDLLMDWRNVISLNENVSGLYIIYQLLLFVSAMVTPGTIFLLIVGALNSAFRLDLITSLVVNLVPVAIFLASCFFVTSKWQLRLASVLSLIYSMVMLVVVVGLGLEMKREGVCSPTTIFLIFIVGAFIIAAVLHPQEFSCLLHGALYFLAIPSMSMLLIIYSICNMHVVSWGTRENAVATPAHTTQKSTKQGKIATMLQKFRKKEDDDVSDYAFSFGNLFKCLCCPRPQENTADSKFAAVLEKLEKLEETLLQRNKTSKLDEEIPSSEKVVINDETKIKDIKAEQKKANEPGVRYNPIYHTKAMPNEDDTPYWIHDPDIGHGKIRYMNKEEKFFWKDLIGKYLFPLVHNEQHQKKMQQDLLQLRNKASLMFFMMNALFIVIIFSLQFSNANDKGTALSIPLPCKDLSTGEPLSLEPLSLFFMAVFGIALLIQFIAMFFHRLATFMHIMASTEANCMKPNQNEVAAMDIASKVQLVKEMQSFVDDDDTQSISTIGSDLDEDSSLTQDDTPKMKRRKTVIRLTRRKRRQGPQSGSLGGKFLTNFMEFAKDLEKRESEHGSNGRKRGSKKGSDKKRSKRAMRALESLEQNKEAVLHKAEAIKDKWRSIATKAKYESTGDKWGSLMRSVMGQSRTSLNTVGEDDKRNSWLRGMFKLSRSNSEFSVNTLPDLGSWSQRNSYAEPILNIITDEIEPVSPAKKNGHAIGVVNNGKEDKNMEVVLESSTKETNKVENIYDTADVVNESERSSDTETESSDASSSKRDKTEVEHLELTRIQTTNSNIKNENGDTQL